jgi:ABC-type multidrug transport system ATPase subunit
MPVWLGLLFVVVQFWTVIPWDRVRDGIAGLPPVGSAPAVPELSGFLHVDEAWRMMAALRGRPGWDGAPARDALGLPGGRSLDALSVGQRRKAELLAAMAGDPAVLLLDEVFAPLDPDATAVVAGWIAAWRATRLVVLTGHGAVPVEPDVVVTLGVSG